MVSNHNKIKMSLFYQKDLKTQKNTSLIVSNSIILIKLNKELKKKLNLKENTIIQMNI